MQESKSGKIKVGITELDENNKLHYYGKEVVLS